MKVSRVTVELLLDLIKRDFIGRYKGSLFGFLWSLFNPIVMLGVYTIVFDVALKTKWTSENQHQIAFPIIIFVGMIVNNFFSECLTRASSLVVMHPSYVKKVVFPIEILTCMTVGSAFIHFCISYLVVLVFCLFNNVALGANIFLAPVIILPLILISMGISWMVSALGVYFRDMPQIANMLATITQFIAPVFFPTDNLPAAYQFFVLLNPITLPIIELRNLLFWGEAINWFAWGGNFLISILVCCSGLWIFNKLRDGFADVL